MKTKMIVVLLLMVVLFVACQSGADEATPTPEAETAVVAPESENTAPEEIEVEPEPQEVQTIRFAVYDWDSGRYEDLIDAFEEENPNYQIKIVSVNEVLELEPFGGEWPEDATMRLASAADVLTTGVGSDAVDQGLLLDMTPLLAEDPTMDEDDFFPSVLEQQQWDGGLWSLPMTTNFELIFYDKDAFDEAGIAYPEAGWTWDDLLTAAKALTIKDGDEVSQWGFVQPFPNPTGILESQGVQVFDLDTDPPTIHIDDPETIEAVQWYADLVLTHEASPYFPPPEEDEEGGSFSVPEGYRLIEEGQAAIWPDFSTSWSFRIQQGDNLGVVPFPVHNANDKSNRVYSDSMAISAGTNKPEAAWAWISFLSDQQEGTTIMGNVPSSLPARKSVAESSGFWDNVDEELGTALRFAVEHAYAPDYVDWGYEAFNEALQAVMEGEDVAETLADAQIAAEEARDEALASEDDAEPVAEISVIEEEEVTNPDAVVIEFMAGGGFDQQIYRDLADQFQEENPDIVVEVKLPNFFSGAPSTADIAQDSDCFQWFPNFSDEESLAAVLSLDPFLNNDPSISTDDFFPATIDQMTYQGQVWGLPGDATVTVMEYNKDLFDEAGLDYPTGDWTVEDFLDYAVALSAGETEEDRVYGYIPEMFEPSDLISFMDRLGAEMMDDSVDPPHINLTDPTVVDAVRWYTDLTTEYDVKPTFMTSFEDSGISDYEKRQALLDNGRGGMWTSNSSYVVTLPGQEEDKDENIGVAPMPGSIDGSARGGFQSVNGYFISAETEARQQCWQWITYLTQQPNLGTGLPARIDVAESSAYEQEVGDERAAAYLHSIENVNEGSFYQLFSEENSWLSYAFFWIMGAYSDILNDGVPVEEALQQAQDTADAYRDCVISNDAVSDEKAQQACLQEVDDSLPDYLFQSEE